MSVKPASPAVNSGPPKQGWWARKLYGFSEKYFNAEYRVADFFQNSRAAKSSAKAGPVRRWLWNLTGFSTTELMKNDFTNFIPSKLVPDSWVRRVSKKMPNPSVRFSTPAMGSMMILLYGGLCYPRAHRGWQRGLMANGERDYREMWDAVRRDFAAITVFIFGLGWANKKLAQWREKQVGLHLTDAGLGGKGNFFSFNAHEVNAKLVNKWSIVDQVKHGNGTGLINAANNNSYFGIPRYVEKHYPHLAEQLSPWIEKYREALKPLRELNHKKLTAEHEALIERQADEAMKALKKLDSIRNEFIQGMKQSGNKGWKKMEKRLPKFGNYLAHFAKNLRAPLDFVSFVAVTLILGWGLVRFNRWWNDWSYERARHKLELEAARKRAKIIDPLKTYQSLHQSSPLFNNFRRNQILEQFQTNTTRHHGY